VLSLGINGDLIDDMPLGEVLQRPDQVRQVDPVHRGAVADVLLEEDDFLVGMIVGETLDKIQLSADGPL
jgi:hypothetical protein